MSKVVNGRIILDKEESKEFLKDIFHPDVEALKKRDAFIGDTKNWTVQRLGNGRIIIDIPDLELPSMSTVAISRIIYLLNTLSKILLMLLSRFQLAIPFHRCMIILTQIVLRIENSPIEYILILMPKSEYPAPFLQIQIFHFWDSIQEIRWIGVLVIMSRTISIKKTTFKNFNFSNFLKPKQTTTLKVNVDTSFALPNTNTMDDGLINFNIDIKPFDGSNLFSLSLHASFIMSWNEQVDLEAAKQIMSEAAFLFHMQNFLVV